MADIKVLPRKFRYNQMMLDDIDSGATPEEVIEFYSEVYPDLTQAVVEGPVMEDDAQVYTFKSRIGTKGAQEKKRKGFVDTALMASLSVCMRNDEDDLELPPSEELEAV